MIPEPEPRVPDEVTASVPFPTETVPLKAFDALVSCNVPLPILMSEPSELAPPSVSRPAKTVEVLSPPTTKVPLVRLTVPTPAKEPTRSA